MGLDIVCFSGHLRTLFNQKTLNSAAEIRMLNMMGGIGNDRFIPARYFVAALCPCLHPFEAFGQSIINGLVITEAQNAKT